MLNALAMLVIYRQVTVFLSMEADRLERKCSWSKHLAPVLAFLIVSRLELIQESGSYMVELLALPFLLEMVFLLLRGLDEAKREREVGFILPVWWNPVLPQDDEYRVSGAAGAPVSVENPEVSDTEAVSGVSGDGGDSRQRVPDLQWDSDEKSSLSLL